MSRLHAAVLVVGLLAAACADDGDDPVVGGNGPTSSTTAADPGGAEPDAEGLSLSVAFDELRISQDVAWVLTVTNEGEPVTLEFRDGQSGDVVLSRSGQEAYRWSRGMVFTQALRSEELGAGEEVGFTLEGATLDGLDPGEYELTATVTSEPAPPPAERTVMVGI